MKKKLIITTLTSLLVLVNVFGQEYEYPYKNPNLAREERIEDLLSRLTIYEKLGLMVNTSQGVERLGIPDYDWWNEALHGVARNGLATVFPQAIGMAATFDPETHLQTFTYVSDEARAKYNDNSAKNLRGRYTGLSFWTPNINIFRDPRWGRGQETYGEDPYLTSMMGISTVRGLQGDDPNYYKTHACAKHYAVHSGPEWNRHSFDVTVSARDLWETYLPAFKALTTQAHVREFMGAYNSYNGDPCCDSDFLIKDILRGRWQYDGLVVSDCGAIDDFYRRWAHAKYPDKASASVAAVRTGTDIECGNAYISLVDAFFDGKIAEEEINVSIRRILNGFFELGIFDPQTLVPWSNMPMSVVDSPLHRAHALKVARNSVVMLKNNGVLPLSPSKVKKIAVIGPNADDEKMMLGNYNGIPSSVTTILEGIREAYPNAEIHHERGCDYVEGKAFPDPRLVMGVNIETHVGLSAEEIAEQKRREKAEIESATPLPVENYTPEALAALVSRVKDADVIFFVGGLTPFIEGEENRVRTEGFRGGDKEVIELPEIQTRMLKTLRSTGVPVVFVLCSGGAVALEQNEGDYDALLCAWYSGQAGGTAVADIISGKVSPSGKLPVTFYKSTDQLPDFLNYDMAGRTYRYMTEEPLYPFGYGLSYANFVYGKARLSAKKIAAGKSVTLSVKLSNKSKVDADEVVQVYVKRLNDPEAPIKALKGFKRVNVKAGKSVNVSIELPSSSFEYYDSTADDLIVKSGNYEILYGSSSADKDLKSLALVIE